jgi:hypothetical protein
LGEGDPTPEEGRVELSIVLMESVVSSGIVEVPVVARDVPDVPLLVVP